MPLHIQPSLRAREEALEAAGLLLSMDSVGVANQKSAEAVGLVAKVVPKTTYSFGGGATITYTAK